MSETNQTTAKHAKATRRQKPHRPSRPPFKRTDALVVLHPDGYVEFFGEPGLRVHVATALAVAPPEEVLAERYLDQGLPKWAERLHYSNKLRASGQCRRVTAKDELERRHDLHIVRGLADLRRESAPMPDAIRKARRASA